MTRKTEKIVLSESVVRVEPRVVLRHKFSAKNNFSKPSLILLAIILECWP